MSLPEVIPRSVLFGNPDRLGPTLSPDGRHLGYVAPEDGVLNVFVGPADGSVPAVAITHDRDRGIRDYVFCHDDRTLVYLQDTAGNEDWRLYGIDLETGESRLLTPEEKVQAQIIGHNRWHPTTMLVALNQDNPQLHDLYRLDLETGALTLDTRNPGFLTWLIDSDLQARGGRSMQPDASILLMRRAEPVAAGSKDADGGDEWTPFLEIPPDDATTTELVGFNRAGDALYLLTSLDANASRLVRLDWHEGSTSIVAEDPRHDIAEVWRHPETGDPQAVVLDEERTRIVSLDPAIDRDLEVLRRLGDGELAVSRSDRADNRWLVSVTPSDGPTRYHLYDRAAGESTYLFAHKDALDDYELAPMEPFSFTARDGLTVHGYLTFPNGRPRRHHGRVLRRVRRPRRRRPHPPRVPLRDRPRRPVEPGDPVGLDP